MQQVPDAHAASSHPSTDGHGVKGALGKLAAPFHKLEEKRAEQAGAFQQREMAKVQHAQDELQTAEARGKKVEARPGLVKVSDPSNHAPITE